MKKQPKKQPLFDMSHFNRIADKFNVPWIDRIPLIESICWGSKGWLDSALVAKLRGRWNGYQHEPTLYPRMVGDRRHSESKRL